MTSRRQDKCSVLVEGVEFVFYWGDFAIGDGVFIPCLDTERVRNRVISSAHRNGIKLSTRVGIFDGKWGVAFWKAA